MKTHRITGGGGVQLHVVESGNPQGRPILYIHGFSQCWLAWSRQLDSDLTRDHRLVAMDMRGHGLSDKPTAGYDGTKLWAEDVHAVIEKLGLREPVLCGWSYGSLVILDYIRHYGSDGIGGVHFVAPVTKLGSEDALAVIGPEFLALIPGFFSADINEAVPALKALLNQCFVKQPSAQDLFLMLGFNVAVPPHVRQALFSRTINNDDVLRKIQKPFLITHGSSDIIVKLSAAAAIKSLVPHAEIHIIDEAGHAPFWDDAASFNARQRAFCQGLGQAAQATSAT